MKTNLLFFVLLCALGACNSQAKKEGTKLESYTSTEIGWTIEIPAGYKLISQAKIEASDKKGKEAVDKVYEGEVNTDSLKHLASFQKNQLNLFDSTIEPYVEKQPGDYEANNKLIKQLIFDTYHKQGIKADTLSSKENIQGQQFNAFHIKVYGPNGTEIMNQIMFSKIIKGYDFGVNISYNNEADKKILLDSFKQSKFAK
ncbi:hypothetical protein GM921_12760 [Pedobacter sp. LMG 31464]|uniref:Lipoprotein n=1 Tax=Pedobacter planticolens TaxID=2679964 RepID=A0A923E2J1_9SPHI|nr:hypothetical protein [Pedobacter planticolens]MBB2146364.1 hypothetical protein [Pedobacter planticolens]